MIIDPDFFLAMSCPHCQDRLLFRRLSPFVYRNQQEHYIYCDCGEKVLSFKMSGKKHFYLSVYCPACLEEHAYIFQAEELRQNLPMICICEDVGINLAFIGLQKPIIEQLNQEGDFILHHQADLRDFFSHPILMAKLLHRFNTMLAENRIACSCSCRDFNLQICFDKLIVSCDGCQSSIPILASRPIDLLMLKKAENILLGPQGSTINFQPGFKTLI